MRAIGGQLRKGAAMKTEANVLEASDRFVRCRFAAARAPVAERAPSPPVTSLRGTATGADADDTGQPVGTCSRGPRRVPAP